MKWEKWDDDILMRYYPANGPAWDGWRVKLPGRSMSAIKDRAARLGVGTAGHARWTDAHDAELEAFAERMGALGHCPADVARRLAQLSRR